LQNILIDMERHTALVEHLSYYKELQRIFQIKD
jgi:hypothetical protein